MEIYLWPNRETADKTWQEFGEPLSHKLRETGARMERFEGYVDNFDINPETDFKELITEFETVRRGNTPLPIKRAGHEGAVCLFSSTKRAVILPDLQSMGSCAGSLRYIPAAYAASHRGSAHHVWRLLPVCLHVE